MIIRKILFSKSAGTKISQFKTWHFRVFSFQIFIVQENVCFRIWFFLFHKFLFKLWFSMKKFATKSCRLKSAGKVRNLFIVRGANRVKTLFFSDVNFSSKSDFSIKIEVKNWVSGKEVFSKNWLFEKFCFRYLPGR